MDKKEVEAGVRNLIDFSPRRAEEREKNILNSQTLQCQDLPSNGGAREHGESKGALRSERISSGQEREGRRDCESGTSTLESACDRHEDGVACKPTDKSPDSKPGCSEEEDALVAKEIAHATTDEQEGGVGECVGRDTPLKLVGVVSDISKDRGQGNRDGGHVDNVESSSQTDQEQEDPFDLAQSLVPGQLLVWM